MDKEKKYQFKHLASSDEKMLVCPKCLELLRRDDIEHFAACPYCNSALEIDGELEDFLLQPFVRHWIARQYPIDPENLLSDNGHLEPPE